MKSRRKIWSLPLVLVTALLLGGAVCSICAWLRDLQAGQHQCNFIDRWCPVADELPQPRPSQATRLRT